MTKGNFAKLEKLVKLEDRDRESIKERGVSPEETARQIEMFRRGIAPTRLERACVVGDGILRVEREEIERAIEASDEATAKGRVSKFVPASGAATRMFKKLVAAMDDPNLADIDGAREAANNGDENAEAARRAFEELERFAFHSDLANAARAKGEDLDELRKRGNLKRVLELLLTDEGLDYQNKPKALVKFHGSGDDARTPLEEHLFEAAAIAKDADGRARVHFTVSPEHVEETKALAERAARKFDAEFEIEFSTQKPSTDTIAADMNDRPFRDENGDILFRPGGHGALLENLNDLDADVVMIKNIDNVQPERAARRTIEYKKLLAGLLVDLRKRAFEYLLKIETGKLVGEELAEAIRFARERLNVETAANLDARSEDERRAWLRDRLDRPMRVAGMVKNEGQPGGGPFWARAGAEVSPQIVETAQMDLDDPEQKRIFDSATHFNPVDIACGLRNYRGEGFNLLEFRDDDAAFITKKSKDGADLKALELPGLWNGGMAKWLTVFVEVPIETFTPVKEVVDLLEPEHQ